MNHQVWKTKQRKIRAFRVRNRIRRVTARYPRPRLTVYRSLKHIYAQLIDDNAGRTIVAASTLDKSVREQLENGKSSDKKAAALVGKILAERAKEQGITDVVFDRGGYKYHGRIAAIASAARDGGLKF